MITENKLKDAAYLLKALANEIRLNIVLELSKTKERNVTELISLINCEQSLISHHLTEMRDKGILKCRKSGRNCIYSLDNQTVIQITQCLLRCNK